MNTNMDDNKKNFKFDVFISYRHSDLDSAAAAYLHKALENYKIPKEIQEKIGKERISRVFRDEEELGAASDLFTEIENNLKESEFLVVILSPRYKESKWCIKEIETFLKYRSRDNILAVIIEGEPYDVFPSILLRDGEPLAMDLRADNKKQMLKYAKERLPRLVAPILNCSYDELYQRHRVYKMRRLAFLSGAVAVISLLFGGITIKQNIEINKNLRAKQENQSRYLAQTANDLLDAGDREAALLVALEALPENSADKSRPYVAEARIALENALYNYAVDFTYTLKPQKKLEMKADFYNSVDFSKENNHLLTLDEYGRVYVWNVKTGENILCYEDHATEECQFVEGKRILGKTADYMYCYNYDTMQLEWEWTFPRAETNSNVYFKFAYSDESRKIICINQRILKSDNNYYDIYIIDAKTGESEMASLQSYFELQDETFSNKIIYDIKFSPDGSHYAVQIYTTHTDLDTPTTMETCVYELEDNKVVATAKHYARSTLKGLCWTDETHVSYIYTDDESILGLGLIENPFEWHIAGLDIATGQEYYNVQTTAMSINYDSTLQLMQCYNDDDVLADVLGVICGNVRLCLDPLTGQVYSRVEDRSQIKLSRMLQSNTTEIIITQDGYVFITSPFKDEIFSPTVNAYHYYLDVGIIDKISSFGGRFYVFKDSSIHWYQPNYDKNLTYTQATPAASDFSTDKSLMYYVAHDNNVYIHSTDTKELLYSDGCYIGYDNSQKAVLKNSDLLAYISPAGNDLCVYDIKSDSKAVYNLEGFRGEDEQTSRLQIRKDNKHSNLLTVWDFSDFYADSVLYKSAENNELMAAVLDMTTGETVQDFDYGMISRQLGIEDGDRIKFHTAALSGDEKFVILPGVTSSFNEKREIVEERFMLVYDLENHTFIKQSEEALESLHPHYSCYIMDGSILPDTSIISLYGYDGNIRIVDVSTGSLLHTLTLDGTGSIGSAEISFTPDGDHIIFQDSAFRLKVYNWREGKYTQQEATAEKGSLEFDFYDDGQLVAAELKVSKYISSIMQMYTKADDGVYKLDNVISSCIDCDGKTLLIADGDVSRFYDYYTFDDIIAMAKDVLGDRQLTEAEKQTYLTE